MNLNSDQIARLQRGYELARQAQTEVSSANLPSSFTSNTTNITNGLSTAANGLKNILDENSQQTSTGRGAGH